MGEGGGVGGGCGMGMRGGNAPQGDPVGVSASPALEPGVVMKQEVALLKEQAEVLSV